jgi:hypothetical protein
VARLHEFQRFGAAADKWVVQPRRRLDTLNNQITLAQKMIPEELDDTPKELEDKQDEAFKAATETAIKLRTDANQLYDPLRDEYSGTWATLV